MKEECTQDRETSIQVHNYHQRTHKHPFSCIEFVEGAYVYGRTVVMHASSKRLEGEGVRRRNNWMAQGFWVWGKEIEIKE